MAFRIGGGLVAIYLGPPGNLGPIIGNWMALFLDPNRD